MDVRVATQVLPYAAKERTVQLLENLTIAFYSSGWGRGTSRHMVEADESLKEVADAMGFDLVERDSREASLNAAAPDMLKALKVVRTWLKRDSDFDMQMIDAAIAKAEGK
jgi:hypothetical protein